MRGEGLVKDVIEGRMEGKRSVARPRIGLLEELYLTRNVDGKKEQGKLWSNEEKSRGSR